MVDNMIKSKIVIEVKIGERNYEFACSPDAPYGEVYDSLNQMRSYIVSKIKEIEEAEKSKEKASEDQETLV